MKITLIGSGNVATHLGKNLVDVGHEIIQVFSRNLLKAKRLADEVEAEYINSLDNLSKDAELYVIAVKDDAIGPVAAKLEMLGMQQKLVVHTSGATPMSIFEKFANSMIRVGVFYPLQTFTKSRDLDFSGVPLCIDASSLDDRNLLTDLAYDISSEVYTIDDEQRACLHLAAVFVNNFTNHLYGIAAEILKSEDLDFEMLFPLIQETVDKLYAGTPKEMQTGPAIRNDQATIARHLDHLRENPEWQEIYRILTKNIQQSQ